MPRRRRRGHAFWNKHPGFRDLPGDDVGFLRHVNSSISFLLARIREKDVDECKASLPRDRVLIEIRDTMPADSILIG